MRLGASRTSPPNSAGRDQTGVKVGGKTRLDLLLVEKGLAASRSQAGDLIKRGLVSLNGAVVTKPGQQFSVAAELQLETSEILYVSRAAHKLLAALEHFPIDVTGRTALDLGASTGGFTQVMLQKGAMKVYAVDVGRDQLHLTLRSDPRVVSMEGVNARDLDRELVPEKVGLITADLSFVSLLKVIEKPLQLASDGCWLVALIKPQFEVGREAVGKGGLVRDEKAVAQAIERISDWVGEQSGWQVQGVIPSPLRGQDGNQEYLIVACKHVCETESEPECS